MCSIPSVSLADNAQCSPHPNKALEHLANATVPAINSKETGKGFVPVLGYSPSFWDAEKCALV